MPILVIDDWNDVSQTFLEKEYENIIHLTLDTAITISSVLGSEIMTKNMQQANK